MPYTVKVDLNTTRIQQVVIQDASLVAAGVMTKLQAQQLADLVEHGVDEAMVWTVTPTIRNDYIAALNEFVLVDSSEKGVTVTLPAASAENKGQVVGVKSIVQGFTNIDVNVDGGGTIDGAADFAFPSRNFYSAIFVSNGVNWDTGYYFFGTPIA